MRIAIYGYGNLGKGVERAVADNPDISLSGIFTRREPNSIKSLTGASIYRADSLPRFKGGIDVVIVCAGSAADLPELTPIIAEDFNVVDSFDTHARIPSHFERVDKAAVKGGNVAVISSGWDPGLFSLARLYMKVALPSGDSYTFWGRGISQGHSDAIRRIPGVADARQYTVPNDMIINEVREGKAPSTTSYDMHKRECFVVAEDGYDKDDIERKIKEMPNYFRGYDTSVTFVTREELYKKHIGMPHAGVVIRCGRVGKERPTAHTAEFSLKLESNPEFTGSFLIATARAAYRMAKRSEIGCKTLFDIYPKDLLPFGKEKNIFELL